MDIQPSFIYDYVCLPPDKQIGLNTHDSWELSYLIKGAGIRTIGEKREKFEEGEIIFIPPLLPHIWEFDSKKTDENGNISNIAIFFTTETLNSISKTFPEFQTIISNIKSISNAIYFTGEDHKRILSLMIGMKDLAPVDKIPLMCRLLLMIARATEFKEVGKKSILSETEKKLDKIRVYSICNYGRHISNEEIASHAEMHKSAFCNFIKRATGQTFTEYLNQIRLKIAKEKLETQDNKISDIAYEVGFSNPSYFNRLFKKYHGVTPTTYKNKFILLRITDKD